MTKLSKILLCICLSIICICGVVSNTYCTTIPDELYTIDLVEILPETNNYYNSSNIQFVKYKNINISRALNARIFYSTSVDKFDDYPNFTTIEDDYTIIVQDQEIKIYSMYHFFKYSDYFELYCVGFSIENLENVECSFILGQQAFVLGLHIVPFDILSRGPLNSVHLYNTYSISYDIEYNNQYYFNNIFGFVSSASVVSGINQYVDFSYPQGVTRGYVLHDNLNNSYNYTLAYNNETKNKFYNKFLLFTNKDLSDIFITKVLSTIDLGTCAIGTVNINRLYLEFALSYYQYNFNDATNLFSGNIIDNNNNSSTVPIGSNSYYKTAKWYDIPTHLYNFFIYLVFDAPIISNFTKLAMVIISFLVETFNFVIGLFNGVSNIFFVSIFVGMLALIFLLKIIFGGKT